MMHRMPGDPDLMSVAVSIISVTISIETNADMSAARNRPFPARKLIYRSIGYIEQVSAPLPQSLGASEACRVQSRTGRGQHRMLRVRVLLNRRRQPATIK